METTMLVSGILTITLIIGILGLFWRLFFVRNTPARISNLDLFFRLSTEMKWLVGFQTAVLGSLLGLIYTKL